MSKTKSEYEIIINNQRIHSFYKEHPRINIEHANLFLIDFFDKIYNHVSDDIESNINAQLLSYICENKKEIESIKSHLVNVNETLSKTQSDILNSVNTQLAQMKKDYIDDVKDIMNNNTLTMNEKMSSILDKNNSHLIDKTTLIINDVLPKNQDQLNKELQLNFKQLHVMIMEDTSKIAQSCNNDKSFTEFIANFEKNIHLLCNRFNNHCLPF